MSGFAKLFDTCEAVTAPLEEAALAAIPAKRGVFALLGAGDAPILVTTAADIRSRLRYRLTEQADEPRRKAADLRQITTAVCWRLTHSRFETDWRYMEIVRAVWPETYRDLLGKRTAWFVAIDAEAPVPDLGVVAGPVGSGRQFGPFPDRRSAERFIDALIDAFDLCRCVSILRQAPHGAGCAYKQMGRCAAPCDGSTSMDAYRAVVGRAIALAAGDREPQRLLLHEKMTRAAEAMQFEQAGVMKGRMERLDEFESPRFRSVREPRDFRFVIIQPGPSRQQACSFVCDRGAIVAGPALEFPPTEPQATDVLAACDALTAEHEKIRPEDVERMGLVAWYLFSGNNSDGLVLSRDDLTPASLCEAIVHRADDLKLRPDRRRKAVADATKPDAPVESQ